MNAEMPPISEERITLPPTRVVKEMPGLGDVPPLVVPADCAAPDSSVSSQDHWGPWRASVWPSR